jgi:hypothetical protein
VEHRSEAELRGAVEAAYLIARYEVFDREIPTQRGTRSARQLQVLADLEAAEEALRRHRQQSADVIPIDRR